MAIGMAPCSGRTASTSAGVSARRAALTLLEVLVSIAIIGILLSLLIPAVMQSRSAAQRLQCQSNLRQISLALANYESLWQVYPQGLTFRYDLLPHLEQDGVHELRPADGSDPPQSFKGAVIPVYICPNDAGTAGIFTETAASYAGCYGSGVLAEGFNGIFMNWYPPELAGGYPQRPVTAADVTDGLSNTAALSEMLIGNNDANSVLRTIYNTPRSYGVNERDALADFCESIPDQPLSFGYIGVAIARGHPWYYGTYGYAQYNHVLPPNRPSCYNQTHVPTGVMTAASLHSGGVNVAYGDGHVVFTSDSIDRVSWRELGSRTDQAARVR